MKHRILVAALILTVGIGLGTISTSVGLALIQPAAQHAHLNPVPRF